jgi:hypothetical protein
MAKKKAAPKPAPPTAPPRIKTSLALGPTTVALVKALAESDSKATGYNVTQSDVIRLAVLKMAQERLPAALVDAILDPK